MTKLVNWDESKMIVLKFQRTRSLSSGEVFAGYLAGHLATKLSRHRQNRHQEYFSKVQVDDDLQTQGEGVIRISSDGDDRMGEKVKSPKNPWDF